MPAINRTIPIIVKAPTLASVVHFSTRGGGLSLHVWLVIIVLAITAPVTAGWLLDRRMAGVFVGMLVVCLGLVALAFADLGGGLSFDAGDDRRQPADLNRSGADGAVLLQGDLNVHL